MAEPNTISENENLPPPEASDLRPEEEQGVEVEIPAPINDFKKQRDNSTSAPSSESSATPQPPNVEGKYTNVTSPSESQASNEEDAPYRYPKGQVPEEDAWFFSQLMFFWVRPLFRRAAYLRKDGKALEHEDLLPLPRQDHGAVVGKNFEDAWDIAHQKAKSAQAASGQPAAPPMKLSELKGAQGRATAKVRQAIGAVIGRPFWLAGFIKVVNTGLQFSFPLLLNAILVFIEDSQNGLIPEDAPWEEQYKGYWLSATLFVAMVAKAVAESVYFHKVYRAGYQSRVAVSVAVYNKSLRLANAERQDTTLGELINLMQVDATKIEMFVPQIHVLWDGLLQITGYMTILYTLIGWPCFAGLALMIATGPIQGVLMGKMFGENHKMAKFTDKRVKTTNECLQGIQGVKMYTWEESFERAIRDCRNGELNHLSTIAYLRAFSRSCMSALPGLVAVLSFVVYAVAVPDASTSASTLFAALAAFDQLRFPLLFYPMALAQLSQAQVSAARIEAFLGMKEVGKGSGASGNGIYNREEGANAGEITVQDATIYWSDPNVPISKPDDDDSSVASKSVASSKRSSNKSKQSTIIANDFTSVESSADTELVYPKPVLDSVNFKVKPGELCAVVGRVASGKSTLCSSVLNETVLGNGSVTLKGKVAFAAQSPWILNATLRDNILFGLPMDPAKYDRVLKACQLSYDLDLLEQGDLTEIGERGINLSEDKSKELVWHEQPTRMRIPSFWMTR
jgi:ATP-binding cassette subfamily C (CFTR/MRP) protein 1